MNTSQLAKDLFQNIGGIDKHDLNNVMQLLSQNDDHHETFAASNYYDVDSMLDSFKRNKCDFSTLTLNTAGINTKYDELTALLRYLNDQKFQFSAILLQETMLSDEDCNSENIRIFNIPHYNLITQGRKCGRNGGLCIYLQENYMGTPKNLYNISTHWEGLFIDVTSPLLSKKIMLGNIY